MKKLETPIPGCVLVEHERHLDHRGYLQELFRLDVFSQLGVPCPAAQDNVSYSETGVLRGLHLQRSRAQGKLVTCLRGKIWDVCVDLRPESRTFRQCTFVILEEDKPLSFYVPKGCAHGFYTLEGPALVHYKCTTLYDKQSDGGVHWNDPWLRVPWPLVHGPKPVTSSKDEGLPSLKEYLKIKG